MSLDQTVARRFFHCWVDWLREFYVPFRRVKSWRGNVLAVAVLHDHHAVYSRLWMNQRSNNVLQEAQPSLFWAYTFGVLWGLADSPSASPCVFSILWVWPCTVYTPPSAR